MRQPTILQNKITHICLVDKYADDQLPVAVALSGMTNLVTHTTFKQCDDFLQHLRDSNRFSPFIFLNMNARKKRPCLLVSVKSRSSR